MKQLKSTGVPWEKVFSEQVIRIHLRYAHVIDDLLFSISLRPQVGYFTVSVRPAIQKSPYSGAHAGTLSSFHDKSPAKQVLESIQPPVDSKYSQNSLRDPDSIYRTVARR